ncbi:hypothetical protein Goari_009355 [Gossypium aridum]|uniref:Uncharacterized protein n=1 Tax=Gossypium aridum TaxID=34290 RepID=A0A7J8XWT6_GOSAI|nr:hypothetical protein [Gossypium aridum]
MALLLFFFYLSQLALAHGSAVKFLPGFEGPLPFELETGYVGVGDSEEAQLFYYFVKSEGKPEDDPLLLWLTGGPGCSAFSGLVFEIGPLKFKVDVYNGSLPTLVYNPYAWTKVSNIIFIDSPVGTGFSYARNNRAAQTGDLKQVHHLHQFLRKWLMTHPDFISNPVYVSGDSYSGIPIPVLAQEISNGKTLTLTSCRDEVSTFHFPLSSCRKRRRYQTHNPSTGLRFAAILCFFRLNKINAITDGYNLLQ